MLLPSTPFSLSQLLSHRGALLVSTCCVLTHFFFVYGQTQVMWYLYFSLEADVSVHAHSVGARAAYMALGLDNPQHIQTSLNHTIEKFTYWDAIHGLWTGHNGPVNPKIHNPGPGPFGKVSAIILVLFSAIWPHVKLILLHLMFYRKFAKGQEEIRTSGLYWLDTFGKWSLADVFVINSLLAVLNLDLPVDGNKLLVGLENQLAVIVNSLEHTATARDAARAVCQSFFFSTQKCEFPANLQDCASMEEECVQCACRLEHAFPSAGTLLHMVGDLLKGTTIDGDAIAVLRVAGRSGIYVFCLATLCSLALSAWCDRLDHRARSKIRHETRTMDDEALTQDLDTLRGEVMSTNQRFSDRARTWSHTIVADTDFSIRDRVFSNLAPRDRQLSFIVEVGGGNTGASVGVLPPSSLEESLLVQSAGTVTKPGGSGNFILRRACGRHGLALTCLLGLFLSIATIWVPTIQRRVPGSITSLLVKDLNVGFQRDYSIWKLVELAGVAGGPDYVLMGVFAVFVIFGPLLRALLLVTLTLASLPRRAQEKLSLFIGMLGVFSAWDVLLLALVLTRAEMPRITQGIVSPSMPICRFFHSLGEPNYCISIEVDFLPSFVLLPVSWILVLCCAARVIRLAFFAFDPFKDQYPGHPRLVAMFAESLACL